MGGRIVLVTGVTRFIGSGLAGRLAAHPAVERVIGVDAALPEPAARARMGTADFARVDIRNPLVARVIEAAGVDTVVHASASASPASSAARTMVKEMNVLGTMQLLAACQRAPSVRRFVLKSTSAVYGASSRDPAVFTEAMQARRVPSGGFAKDSLDIEGYVRAFARRRPDVEIASLRFTNFIGPRIDSLLTGFFRMPVVPTALGYDARVQLLHEDDALAVLTRATTGSFVGTVNVGGEGTLLLSQAIRRLGHVEVPLPTPALGSVGRLSRRFGFVDYSPEQMRFLNFGRVVDTTVLRTEFGYTPRYTTETALKDYARTVPPVISPRIVVAAMSRVRNVLGQVGGAATAVGERLRPTPPSPGLRAVRDA
jgi:UDP-glucose 4-epimerase